MTTSLSARCKARGPQKLLALPLELLTLVCEKYFENDELSIRSPLVLQPKVLSKNSRCILNIELVCHHLFKIARGVRDRVWAQRLTIKLPDSVIAKEVIEGQRYQWLRDHIQFLTIDHYESTPKNHSGYCVRNSVFSTFLHNCPRVHTVHINSELLKTVHRPAAFSAFTHYCRNLEPVQARAQSQVKKPSVHQAATILNARCGEAYQILLTTNCRVWCTGMRSQKLYYLV